MKYIIAALLFCFGLNVAVAQEVYTSTGRSGEHAKKYKKQKGYDPSKLILGGTAIVGFGGGYADLGIMPFIGYHFTKNFSAGVGLGYEYLKSEQYLWNGVEYQNYPAQANIISPNIWARHTIWRNLYASGVFEYDYMMFSDYNYTYDNNGNTIVGSEKNNIGVPCLLLGPGYRMGNGRFSGYFELLYDVLQQPNSPYYGTIVPRIGLCVGL